MTPIRPSIGRSTTEHPATSTGDTPVGSAPTPTVRTPPTRDAARDSVDLVLTEASRRGTGDTSGRTLGPRERFTAELSHYRALRDTNPTEAGRIMREVLPGLSREIAEHLRSSPGECLEDLRMLRSYRREAIDWQNAHRPGRSLTDSRDYDAHEAHTAELERELNGTNAAMRVLRDHLRTTFYVAPGHSPTADQIRGARFCAEISHELGEYVYLRDDLRTWTSLMRASGADTFSPEEAGGQALALFQAWSVLRDAAAGRIERDSGTAPLGMTADEIAAEMSNVRDILMERVTIEGPGRDSVRNYLGQLIASDDSRRIGELTLENLGTYAEGSAALQTTIDRANAATDPAARRPILLTALREAVALGSDSEIRRIRDMLNATLPAEGTPGRDATRLEMLLAEQAAIGGHELSSEALVRTEIEGLCAQITARENSLLTPDDRTGHLLASTHMPSGTAAELAGRARALTLAHSYYASVGDAQAGLMFPSLRRVRSEMRLAIRDHADMSPTDYAGACRALSELSLSMTDSRDVEIRFRTDEIYNRLIGEAEARGEDVSWSHSQRTIRERAHEMALHEYSTSLRHDLDRWLVSIGRLRTATPPVEMGTRLEHLRAAATTVRLLRTLREGDAPLIDTPLIEERVRIVEGQLTAFFEDGLRQPADAPAAQRTLADSIVYDLRTRVHFAMAESASSADVSWLSSLSPAGVRSFAETSQAAHLLTSDVPHDPPTTEELQAFLQAAQLYASIGLNNRVRETAAPLTRFAYSLDATDPAAAAQRANLLLVVSQIYSQTGGMDAEVRSALEGVVALDRPGELHDTSVLARAMLAMQRGDLTAAQEFLLTIPDHPMAATFIEGIRSGQRAQRIAQIVGVLRAVSLNYIERGREAGEDMAATERDTLGGWQEVQRLMISGECSTVDSALTRMLESRRFPNFTTGTNEFHIGSNVGAFMSTVSNPAISEAQFHDAVFELCGFLRMDDYFMAASQIYQTMEGDPRLHDRAREHLDAIPAEMRFHSGLNVARTLLALRAGPAGMIGMSMTSGGSPDEMVEGVAMTVVPFAIARVAAVGAEGLFVARATGGTVRMVRGGEVVVAAGSRTVSGLGAMRFGVRSVTEATVFTASSMGMHSLFTGRTDNWTYSNFGTEFGTMLLTFGLCHGVGIGVRGLGRAAARVESFRAPGMSAELGEAALRPGVRTAVGVVGYAGTIGSLTGLEYFNEATGLHHSEGEVPFYLRLMSSALTDASMRAAGSRIDAISGGRIATFESSIHHAEMVHDLVPVLERMGYERPSRTGELSPEATVVLHTMMARVSAGESVSAVAESMDIAAATRYREVVRENLGVDPNSAEGRQAMALLYTYVHNGRTPAEARAMAAHLAENVAAIRRSADSFLSEAGIEAGPTRRALEHTILVDALSHGRSAAEVSSLATHSTEFGERIRSIVNGALGPRGRSTPEGQQLMALLVTRAISGENFRNPMASLEAVADALPQITAAMTRGFEGLGELSPAVRRGLASLILLRAMSEGGENSGAIAHEVEAFANNAAGLNEAVTNLARMLGFGGAQSRVDLLAWAIRDGITPGALRGIASRVADGSNTISIDAETGRVTVRTVAEGDRAAAREAVSERTEPPAAERRGGTATGSTESPPLAEAAFASTDISAPIVEGPRAPSPAELLPQVHLLARIRSAAGFSGTVEPAYLRALLNSIRSGELVLTEEMASRMETIFADPRTDAALDHAHPMQADRVRSALITEVIRGRVTSAENVGETVRAIIERPTSFEGYSLGRGGVPGRIAPSSSLPEIATSSEGFDVLDRFSFAHGTETGVIHTARDGSRATWSQTRVALEAFADPGMPAGPLVNAARHARGALETAYARAEEIQRLSAEEPNSPRLASARSELAEATRTLESWEARRSVWTAALEASTPLAEAAAEPHSRIYAALEPSLHEYDAEGSPLTAEPRSSVLSAVAERIVVVRHAGPDTEIMADAWLDPARGDQGRNPLDVSEIDMVVRGRDDIGAVADAAEARIRESDPFHGATPEIHRSADPTGTVRLTFTHPRQPNIRFTVRVIEASVERAERIVAEAAFERAARYEADAVEIPAIRGPVLPPEVVARREARTERPPGRRGSEDSAETHAGTPRSRSRARGEAAAEPPAEVPAAEDTVVDMPAIARPGRLPADLMAMAGPVEESVEADPIPAESGVRRTDRPRDEAAEEPVNATGTDGVERTTVRPSPPRAELTSGAPGAEAIPPLPSTGPIGEAIGRGRRLAESDSPIARHARAAMERLSRTREGTPEFRDALAEVESLTDMTLAAALPLPPRDHPQYTEALGLRSLARGAVTSMGRAEPGSAEYSRGIESYRRGREAIVSQLVEGGHTTAENALSFLTEIGRETSDVRPGPVRSEDAPRSGADPLASLPTTGPVGEAVGRGRRLAESDSPIAGHTRAAMERLGNTREGTPEFRAALAEVETLTEMANASGLRVPGRDHPTYREALAFQALARGAVASLGRAEPGSAEYTDGLAAYRRGRDAVARELVEAHRPAMENVLNFLTEVGAGGEAWNGVHERFPFLEAPRMSEGIAPHGRLKAESDVLAKLNRRGWTSLDTMTDFAGTRAVVESYEDVTPLLAAIQSRYTIREVRDADGNVVPGRDRDTMRRLIEGARSGYRAIHIVVEVDGRPVEIQVQTRAMYEWGIIQHGMIYSEVRGTGEAGAAGSTYTLSGSARSAADAYCREVATYLADVEHGAALGTRPSSDAVVRALPRDIPADARESVIAELNAMDDLMSETVARLRPTAPAGEAEAPLAEVISLSAHRRRSETPVESGVVAAAAEASTILADPVTAAEAPRPAHLPFPAGPEGAGERRRFAQALEAQLGSRLAGLMEESEVNAARAYIDAVGRGEEPSAEATSAALDAFSYHVSRSASDGSRISGDVIRIPAEPPAEGSMFRATVLAVDEAAGTIRIRRSNGAEVTLIAYIPGASPFRPDQVVAYLPSISGASGSPFRITAPSAPGGTGEIRPNPGATEFRVGRNHGSTDGMMSRDHAVFRRRYDGRWTVEDLGSLNGVFALGPDGRPFRLAPNSPLNLVDGAELVIGTHRYTFRSPLEAGRVLPVAELNAGVPEVPVLAPPAGGSRFTVSGITVERAGDHWYAVGGETPLRINGASRRGTNPLRAGDVIEIGGRSYRFQPEVEVHTLGSDIAGIRVPRRFDAGPMPSVVVGGRVTSEGVAEISLSDIRTAGGNITQAVSVLRMSREVAESNGFRFNADGSLSRTSSPGSLVLDAAPPPPPVYAPIAVVTHTAPETPGGAYRSSSSVPRVDVPRPVDRDGNIYSISGDPAMVAGVGMVGGGSSFIGHPVRTDIHPDGTAYVTFVGRVHGEAGERTHVLRMNADSARELGLSRGDAPARDYLINFVQGPARPAGSREAVAPPPPPLPPPLSLTGSDGVNYELRASRVSSSGRVEEGFVLPNFFGRDARLLPSTGDNVRISMEIAEFREGAIGTSHRVEISVPRARAIELQILRSDGTLVSDSIALHRPTRSEAPRPPSPPPPPGTVRFPGGEGPREFSFGRASSTGGPDLAVGDDMRMVSRRQATFRLENGLLSVRAVAGEGTWYLNGNTWYEITPERGPVLLPEGTRIAFGRPSDIDVRTSPRSAPFRSEGSPDLIAMEVRANGELRASPESGLRWTPRTSSTGAEPSASVASAPEALPISAEPREIVLDSGLRLAFPDPGASRGRSVSMPGYMINDLAIVSSDGDSITFRGNMTNLQNLLARDSSTTPVTFRMSRSAAGTMRIVGPDGRILQPSLALSRSTFLPADVATRLGLPVRAGEGSPVLDVSALPEVSPRSGRDEGWRERPAEDLGGISGGSNEGIGYGDHNEDRFVVARRPDGRVVTVVIDGMGGHGGGERASSIARSVVRQAISRGASVEEALDLANAAIAEENAGTRGRSGAVAVGVEVESAGSAGYDITMRRVGDSDAAVFDLSEGASRPILGRTERHAAGETMNIRLDSNGTVATCLGLDGTRSVVEETRVRAGAGSVVLAGSDGFWENFANYSEIREIMASSPDRSAEGLRSALMTEVRVRQALLAMRRESGPERWVITPERYREAFRSATGSEAPADAAPRYVGAEITRDARVIDSSGRAIGRFKADNVTLVVQVVGERIESGTAEGRRPRAAISRPSRSSEPVSVPLGEAAREPSGVPALPSLLVVGVPPVGGRGSGSGHPYRVSAPESADGNQIYRLSLDERGAPGHVPSAIELRSPSALDESALEALLSPRRREVGVEVRATYGDIIPLADMPNGGGAASMIDFYAVAEESLMNSVASPGPSVAIVDPMASNDANHPLFALQRTSSGYRLILQGEGVAVNDPSGAPRPSVRGNPRAFDLRPGDRVRFGMTELSFDGSSFRLPMDVSTEARLRVPAGAL